MSASPIRQQCYTSETATEGLHKLFKENIATCSYEQPHPQPRRTVRKTCMAHELRRVPGSTHTCRDQVHPRKTDEGLQLVLPRPSKSDPPVGSRVGLQALHASMHAQHRARSSAHLAVTPPSTVRDRVDPFGKCVGAQTGIAQAQVGI